MNLQGLKKSWLHFIIAAFGTSVLMAIISVGFQKTGGLAGEGSLNRILTLLGGNIIGGGYIQALTYIAFIWSMLEIVDRFREIKHERRAFQLKFLSTNEKHLLLAADINELQFKINELEKKNKHRSLVSSLIKKVCQKFRSSKSVPEVLEIITIQTDINKEKAESDQSLIRYLTWVIPSIGFIGTVLGISQALSIANSGDMNLIANTLGIAFDTTLISLILSIIVMFFFHDLQERTDKLHAQIKEYVVENLVNKIEL